jgi:hypothetical protein
MSHRHAPEKDGGVRILVDTLSVVDIFREEIPDAIFCAGKTCDYCGDPSIVMASLGNKGLGLGVRVTETLKLSDAEALANHILAEVKRLRDAGHVEKEETHAVQH